MCSSGPSTLGCSCSLRPWRCSRPRCGSCICGCSLDPRSPEGTLTHTHTHTHTHTVRRLAEGAGPWPGGGAYVWSSPPRSSLGNTGRSRRWGCRFRYWCTGRSQRTLYQTSQRDTLHTHTHTHTRSPRAQARPHGQATPTRLC